MKSYPRTIEEDFLAMDAVIDEGTDAARNAKEELMTLAMSVLPANFAIRNPVHDEISLWNKW